MNPRWPALAGLLLAAAVLAGPAAAPASAADIGSGRAKPNLMLIGSNARLGFNDNGAPGSSVGDVRTLALTMSTAGGRAVGTADIVQTLTDEAEVDRAVKVVVISLPKGTIAIQGLTTFTDFMDPASRPNDETEQLAIVGGTGAYRGAAGSVDITLLPGFRSRWQFSFV